MSKNLTNLIQEATSKSVEPRLKEFAKVNGIDYTAENRDEILASLKEAEEFYYAQFTGRLSDGQEATNLPAVSINEALNTSDVSVVFPRVISQVLQEPKEPNLFLQNVVADTIKLANDSPLLIEFPTVGALQAFNMAEGQEYTAQTLSFQQHMTSIRIGKIGVAASLTEEIVNQSMWNLIELHMRLMSNAIDRRVETILYKAMTERAQIVFNNESTDTQYRTTGKAVSSTTVAWNGSFSYNDLVKMCGVLLQNRYEGTHFLAHPLMWPIFAQDPILRAQFYHGGQLGAGIWTRMPAYDQTANFPFGITYVPYYALPFTENTTFSGTAAGSTLGSAPVVSDVYLIDRKNSLFMATRGDTQMDQMDNWYRDATMLKAKKYVGVSAKDQGRGMVVAKNIRVVVNEEPLFNIRTITT
jgi:hypothetical protein